MTSRRRCAGGWLVVALAVVCVALHPLLSTDRIPVFRDLLVYVVPIKHFLGDRLRAGEIPLWNPWIFLGSPFVAAMHMGAFYPPSAVLILPLPLGFNAFLLVHYLSACAGMWAFLRARRLGVESAALGALTYAAGGYAVSLLNITKELHGAAWLPWALFFWARWLAEPSRRLLAGVMLALGLEVLGGSVETLLMTIVLLGVVLLESDRRTAASTLAALGIAVLGAFALTAFQVLPTLEYAMQSERGRGLPASQVLHWSLQPASLLSLLIPVPRGAEGMPGLGVGLEPYPPMLESVYIGIPALGLALTGIFAGRRTAVWSIALAVAFVAALGSSTPIVPTLYELAPSLLGRLRYPEKLVLVVHVAAVVLAAEGLAEIEGASRRPRIAVVVFAALVGAAAVGVGWMGRTDPEHYLRGLAGLAGRAPTAIVPLAEVIREGAPRLALLTAAVVGLVLLAGRLRSGVGAASLLFAVQAVDLATVPWRSLVTESWPEIVATRPLVDVDALRVRGQSVFHYGDVNGTAAGTRLAEWPLGAGGGMSRDRAMWASLVANVPMVHQVATLGGGDGLLRRDVGVLLDTLPRLSLDGVARVLGGLGVAYLIGPSARDDPSLMLVSGGTDGLPFVYEIRGATPFARLIDRVHVESREAEALAWMARPEFDARREAVVDSLPADRSPEAGPLASGEGVELVGRSSDVLDLRVNASRTRLLVVNASFYPGWRATLDGAPTEIVRANALVRGVLVPAGEHQVRFRFHPASLFVGAWIAAAAAILLLIAVARRDPNPPGPRRADGTDPDDLPSSRARSTAG